jgi:Uma2 family endonuclease
MSRTAVQISPSDAGRRMSLEEFDQAETAQGHSFELSRGVITVVDVPGKPHFDQVYAVQKQLFRYDLDHPGVIYQIGGGGEAKLLIWDSVSERHPDLVVYKTPPSDEGKDLWSTWIPAIVIELVSVGSEERDYEQKPEEYLKFGVSEYWVVDSFRGAGQLTVFRRHGGRWVQSVVNSPDTYRTKLLPGFELNLEAVFRRI